MISIGSGAIAVVATSAGELSKIDSNLNVLAQASKLSSDPVGSALLNLDSIGSETEVGFYSINKDFTVLGDVSSIVRAIPKIHQLRLAAKQPITISQSKGGSYRLRTSEMPDSEFVVYATSLDASVRNTNNNIWLLALVTGFALALGALLIWLLTRKDLKRIDHLMAKAKEIADGNFNVEIEIANGKSELDTLNNSLVSMIGSLKTALASESLNKQKMKEFIADASHELKTPLTLIRGYTELLFGNENLDPDVIQRSRVRVEDQIHKMQSLIADLLLLAELEQTQEPETQRVDFSELVQAAFDDLRILHPDRKITASVAKGLFIDGSRPLLEQLMSNLISNLSRYVPDACEITFNLFESNGWVHLQVDDSGPGLPEASYKGGVQQFHRFDASRSRQSGGSGLGLSIIAAIVARHRGTVKLSKSPMGGLRTAINLEASQGNS